MIYADLLRMMTPQRPQTGIQALTNVANVFLADRLRSKAEEAQSQAWQDLMGRAASAGTPEAAARIYMEDPRLAPKAFEFLLEEAKSKRMADLLRGLPVMEGDVAGQALIELGDPKEYIRHLDQMRITPYQQYQIGREREATQYQRSRDVKADIERERREHEEKIQEGIIPPNTPFVPRQRLSENEIADILNNANDTDILTSMAMTESGGDPNAVSPKGAQGLMQFMPKTARAYDFDPFNPRDALQHAREYFEDLTSQFGGDKRKAVAAYNAGPEAVERAGGIPNYPETQDYVGRVAKGVTTRAERRLEEERARGQLRLDEERARAELEKTINKPVSSDAAGKKAMMLQSVKDLQEARRMLFPGGKFDRSVLISANAPFGGVGEKGRLFSSRLQSAISTRLLVQTGVAASPGEFQRLSNAFIPSAIFDTPGSAMDKLNRLEEFLHMGLDEMIGRGYIGPETLGKMRAKDQGSLPNPPGGQADDGAAARKRRWGLE